MKFPGNDFWTREQMELWGEVDSLALASLYAGALAAETLLPSAAKTLINYERFNLAAMRYLRSYQLTTVQNITDTTRRKATELIAEWLRSGEALPQLETKLATILNSRRAAQIAVTEVTRIFANGNLMLWETTGVVTSKVWRTARDELVCPLCGPLHGTVVSTETQFQQTAEQIAQTSQMKRMLGSRYSEELAIRRANNMIKWNNASVPAPPRHVNCRCWLQPVVSVQGFEEG